MKAEERKAAIISRVVIKGVLHLDSPLLIGRGETSDGTDIQVFRDKNGTPCIPGTSLMGALREALRQCGFDQQELLFGTEISKTKSALQSAVQIEDVVLTDADTVERDGIRIDTITGTVETGGKFDYEAVERGAHGEFRLDVAFRGAHKSEDEGSEAKALLYALTEILRREQGFSIGAHTAKGFGKVHGDDIRLYVYDFSQKDAVHAWLRQGWKEAANETFRREPKPVELSNGEAFLLEAGFSLRSSLIVRSRNTEPQDGKKNISAVQMRDSGEDFLIPGSSLKGALRSRAAYILRRMGLKEEAVEQLLGEFMGMAEAKHSKKTPNTKRDEQSKKKKSRLYVNEIRMSPMANGICESPQSRNRIDRFTNGTVDKMLFTTQPLWKDGEGAPVEICLKLLPPLGKQEEDERHREMAWKIGLLLFLLRDLWQGSCALGGEKAVGRGTLSGQWARMKKGLSEWKMNADGGLEQGSREELENYAAALREKVKEVQEIHG